MLALRAQCSRTRKPQQHANEAARHEPISFQTESLCVETHVIRRVFFQVAGICVFVAFRGRTNVRLDFGAARFNLRAL